MRPIPQAGHRAGRTSRKALCSVNVIGYLTGRRSHVRPAVASIAETNREVGDLHHRLRGAGYPVEATVEALAGLTVDRNLTALRLSELSALGKINANERQVLWTHSHVVETHLALIWQRAVEAGLDAARLEAAVEAFVSGLVTETVTP